jgi:hypothetical protein
LPQGAHLVLRWSEVVTEGLTHHDHNIRLCSVLRKVRRRFNAPRQTSSGFHGSVQIACNCDFKPRSFYGLEVRKGLGNRCSPIPVSLARDNAGAYSWKAHGLGLGLAPLFGLL